MLTSCIKSSLFDLGYCGGSEEVAFASNVTAPTQIQMRQ
jgi:hypothetical protein